MSASTNPRRGYPNRPHQAPACHCGRARFAAPWHRMEDEFIVRRSPI